MSNIDTAKAVLAKASLFDQTFSTPDLGVAVAWAEALGRTNQADAVRAVTEHYQTQTRRIMPADVIAAVRRIRAERLRDAPLEPAYDGVDVRGTIAEIKAHRRAVGDGLPLAAVPALPDRSDELAELLGKAADATVIPAPNYNEDRARFPVAARGATP